MLKKLRKFQNGGYTVMPEIVVAAQAPYTAGYDSNGNPMYTMDRTLSMGYEGTRLPMNKKQLWANGNRSTEASDYGKIALTGIGLPLIATSPIGGFVGNELLGGSTSDVVFNSGLIGSKIVDNLIPPNNNNPILGTPPELGPHMKITKWSKRGAFKDNVPLNAAERLAAQDFAESEGLKTISLPKGRPSYKGNVGGLSYDIRTGNPNLTHKSPKIKVGPKTVYRNRQEELAEDKAMGIGKAKREQSLEAKAFGTGDRRHLNKGRELTEKMLENFRGNYPHHYNQMGRWLIKRKQLKNSTDRMKINELILDYMEQVKRGL